MKSAPLVRASFGVDEKGRPDRGGFHGFGGFRMLVRDLLELTKARVGLMVLLTTVVGFWVGAASGGASAGVWTLVHTLLATGLLAGGGATLNQVMEKDRDGRMGRTRHRPVPSGRMSARSAWLIGTVLTVAGILYLLLGVGPLAAVLGSATAFAYVFVYTPLKRYSHVSTLVGAVPGALPPLIGWAAATGTLDPHAWILFGILFFWQLPHFLAIAWLFRDDYAQGGYPMLTVVEPTGMVASRQMLGNSLALLVVSLMPTMVGQCGAVYYWTAFGAGVVFLGLAAWFCVTRTRRAARAVVLGSVVYLPVVLITMILDLAA